MTKDWVHGVGHCPVCQILVQIVVRGVITSSAPAWTSSAGMLSTSADFPFFIGCTATSTSLRRMGWSSSMSVWVQFSTDGSPLALWLYSSEQYSVHRCGPVAEGFRRRTLASSSGPPQNPTTWTTRDRVLFAPKHSQATLRQKVQVG